MPGSKQNAALSPESLNGLMVHQPNENHICDICNKIFVSRSKMIRHMTNVHPLNIHKVQPLSQFRYAYYFYTQFFCTRIFTLL